jgi:cysteinyl-tRNA synthetase
MALVIYNTSTRQKEAFQPDQKPVRMFVCGPTVYDYIHIGNARTFVFFDVVAKYLRYRGYDTQYIQNITDIDDKIISHAQKENQDPLILAQTFTEAFTKDMENLGVTAVSQYASATAHIEQVIQQVKILIEKNHAYLIEGDGYYFDLTTFPEYGKLSGRNQAMADDAVSRIDENDHKRNRGDFCLWKFAKPDEPSWDFETGKYIGILDLGAAPAYAKASAGRPGWHIEDTACPNTTLALNTTCMGADKISSSLTTKPKSLNRNRPPDSNPLCATGCTSLLLSTSRLKCLNHWETFLPSMIFCQIIPKRLCAFFCSALTTAPPWILAIKT